MGNKFLFVFGGQQGQQCESNIQALPSWTPRGETPAANAARDTYWAVQWTQRRGTWQNLADYAQRVVSAYNSGFWYEKSLLPGTTPPPATAVYGSEKLWPDKFSLQQNYALKALQQFLWQQGFITVPPPATAVYGSEWLQPSRFSLQQNYALQALQQYLWQQGIIASSAVYGSEWLQPSKFSLQQNYALQAASLYLWQQGIITAPPPATAVYGSEWLQPSRLSLQQNFALLGIQQWLWQQGFITVPPPDTAIYGSEYNPLHSYPFLLSTSRMQQFLWQQRGTITQAVTAATSKTAPQRRHLTLKAGF